MGEDRPVEASYRALYASGELERRADRALTRLTACDLCPRRCCVDRTAGETGECRTGRSALVASAAPHFGEERPLVGRSGSGTIFFAGCNLACVYCQNADISHRDRGRPAGGEALARLMLDLHADGCNNINLVSPSHVVPQLLEALVVAAGRGLHLPLVYNSGGYDAVDTLRLLDGVVDIYMPDMKYADPATGERFSAVPDYPTRNRAAVKEMHRQVGDLQMDRRGVAQRGLLVRHLVLPAGVAGTHHTMEFLAREISPRTYVNVMDQYRPHHQARCYPPLERSLRTAEYREALDAARRAGLTRLDGVNGGAFF